MADLPPGIPPPSSTGGSSSSSSSSSPSSSSSSSGTQTSSGPSEAEQRAVRAAIAAMENQVLLWGIPLTKQMRNLIARLAKEGASSAQFLQAIRKTKEYAVKFAGIMRADGTLRMSEAAYISGYQAAKDYAASIGRHLSPEAYGRALKNGNSPSEIKQKLLTIDKLKSYGPELAEFNDYLLSTGQIKKPLNRKELQDFVMGYRKDLQQAWTTAHTAFQLQELAGVNVGKPGAGNEVSYKELKGMLKRFQALGGDPEQVDFVKMGALISEVIPKSDLYGAGITKKNVVNMMLSGKDAPEITKRVQQVLDTYEAAVTEPGAQAPTYAGQVHLGTPGRGASE